MGRPLRKNNAHGQIRRNVEHNYQYVEAHQDAGSGLPSEDNTQDPHILRAIGRAWAWRRRMEAGEFGTVRDLAIAVNLAERHVSRQLRLAYLAPEVLKRLVFRREVSAVTVMQLSDCAGLPWADQAGVVFGQTLAPPNHQKG